MPNTTSDHSHSLTYPSEGATSWFATIVTYHQTISNYFDDIGTTEINLIDDASGNEVLAFTSEASAVNYINIDNAATGGDPNITALGDDTNVHLSLSGKGTGGVKLSSLRYPTADGTWKKPIITDASGTLTIGAPYIEQIFDSNSNEVVTFTETASAVNYLDIKNSATTANVEISAAGDDANVGISILPKSGGALTLDYVTMPAADGSAGQWLQTNGAGALSWSAVLDIVNDSSPQLGGNLDPNGYSIIGDLLPSPDETYDLGSTTAAWQDLFMKRLSFDDGSNYLTNYQVGTWTPAFGRDGSGSPPSYTVQEGYYVYIGPLVMAWFNVEITANLSAGSGDVYIDGLPATAMNDADYITPSLAWGYQSGNEAGYLAEVLYNSDRIYFHNPDDTPGNGDWGWDSAAAASGPIEQLTALCGVVMYRSA